MVTASSALPAGHAVTPTRQMMARVEDAGYQFLQTETSWSLYDLDDRSEVNTTRAKALGDSIWLAAEALGLQHEGE